MAREEGEREEGRNSDKKQLDLIRTQIPNPPLSLFLSIVQRGVERRSRSQRFFFTPLPLQLMYLTPCLFPVAEASQASSKRGWRHSGITPRTTCASTSHAKHYICISAHRLLQGIWRHIRYTRCKCLMCKLARAYTTARRVSQGGYRT